MCNKHEFSAKKKKKKKKILVEEPPLPINSSLLDSLH